LNEFLDYLNDTEIVTPFFDIIDLEYMNLLRGAFSEIRRKVKAMLEMKK